MVTAVSSRRPTKPAAVQRVRPVGPPARLDILVMKEGEWWVAQCLQYDLTAQSRALSDLKYAFEYALVGHIVTSVENNLEPFEQLPPAPQMYWDAWRRALPVEERTLPRFRIPRRIPPRYVPREQEFRVGDLARA